MRKVSLWITIAIAVGVGIAITADLLTVQQAAAAAGLVVIAWFAGYFALAKLHARRFNAESVEVMGLLERGELDQAAERWSRWTRGATVPAVVVAAARHDVAWVTLRRGQLRPALALIAENERLHLRALRTSRLDSISALDRGLCHALLGELDQARHAVAEAGMRSTRAHGSYPVAKALVEAVIACREGRAAHAATFLAAGWAEYERLATGDLTRPLRVIRAFAAGDPTLLAAVRPAYPGEYAFLAVEWPELATFLASHEL